ncbi:XF1762 family protein [Amycolatopsis sp., V23-08]|uniref:XF1762 family protein n=1 Tax=Amycolatopsis heterodermiae TaxID=3110235 RepID=A0ABU5QXM4_9PSEU|nr:XF1762 family protein [Amycolatopsis sp., V23-08]MEA5358239.1 XF1762 family protein [Amycolatopsis sp., V23-08]
MRLTIVPLTFRQACEFIDAHHRHHRPPRGMKFAIGVARGGELVGVATAGRPVARCLDDGITLEVTRSCTVGEPNANSKLYGAVWRAARAMGYLRLITYTQAGESGASLRAAGLVPVADLRPRSGWTTTSRPRQPRGVDGVRRTRWEISSGATLPEGSPCRAAASAGTAGRDRQSRQ